MLLALAQRLHEGVEPRAGLRLRADEPVAAHLSGGLDSSLLSSSIVRRKIAENRTESLYARETSLPPDAYFSAALNAEAPVTTLDEAFEDALRDAVSAQSASRRRASTSGTGRKSSSRTSRKRSPPR
jgi:hypothetical protein